jgi:hypothetical protein
MDLCSTMGHPVSVSLPRRGADPACATHAQWAGAGTYPGRMEIPIACRLEDTAARGQIEEWGGLLGHPGMEASRVSPTEVAVRVDDLDQLPALIGLARREKACCPFFDFGLEIGAEVVTLTISAPREAASILDLFAPPRS